ncbi:MAG: serine O-acetyltransferase EpsC [Burkholderiaceae bacterium]
MALDIAGIVAQLRSSRERWRDSQGRSREIGGRELPSLEALASIIDCLRGALFPMRLGPPNLRQETEDYYVGHTLDKALSALLVQVRLELRYRAKHEGQGRGEGAVAGSASTTGAALAPPSIADDARALEIVRAFGATLSGIRDLLDTDVTAAFEGDPAARSVDEVLLCYPGVHAMIHHRIAHALYRLGVPLLARLVAEIAHGDTGIDIHPGATIGPGFFIDHGTGIVIGETALIGRNVRLYQQVTLGAKRFAVDDDGKLRKGGDRHPVVEDDVVVYAGATILGRVTIGRGSSIGGNVWLTRSVPPHSHITQARSQEDPRDDAVVSSDASR